MKAGVEELGWETVEAEEPEWETQPEQQVEGEEPMEAEILAEVLERTDRHRSGRGAQKEAESVGSGFRDSIDLFELRLYDVRRKRTSG